MRHYRRNADDQRRRLERLACQGDGEARAQLFIDDLRAGKTVEEIALNVLTSLSIREMQELDGPSVAELVDDMTVARQTRLFKGRGGWFPDHARQDVCPRGHSIAEENFDHNIVSTDWSRAREATEDVLVVDMDREYGDMDSNWTTCRVCTAAWPTTSWEWGE